MADTEQLYPDADSMRKPYTHHDPLLYDLQQRMGRLEDETKAMMIADHHANLELALMRKDLSYIKDAQDKVTVGVNRILWAIGLSVLTAISAFVLTGGLYVVPV